jgi:hypothetical protein
VRGASSRPSQSKGIQGKGLGFPWIPLAESGLSKGLERIQIENCFSFRFRNLPSRAREDLLRSSGTIAQFLLFSNESLDPLAYILRFWGAADDKSIWSPCHRNRPFLQRRADGAKSGLPRA